MVVIKRTQPGGRYTLNWEGATVLADIEAAATEGMQNEAKHIRGAEQAELHVWHGDMKREAFAEVEIRGTKRTLRVGSDAGHTKYHEEFATSYTPHPQFHRLVEQHAPHITQEIKKSVEQRGYKKRRR